MINMNFLHLSNKILILIRKWLMFMLSQVQRTTNKNPKKKCFHSF